MNRKRLLPILLTVVGLLSLATAVYMATARGVYVVYDGGEQIIVSGSYQTVEETLLAAGIQWRSEDLIAPPLADLPDPDTPIKIERARSVAVRTGEGTRSFWTTRPTLGSFLAEADIEIERGAQIYADGKLAPTNAFNHTPLPKIIEIGRFLNVVIKDGQNKQTLRTNAETVGGALQEAGISVYAADSVEPPRGARLSADMVIEVQRSFLLTIYADGQVVQTRSHGTAVLDALTKAGITLIGNDYTRPAVETRLKQGDDIHVIRVTEDFRQEEEITPYQTIYQASPDLLIDTKAIVSAGVSGIVRKRIRVRYENGVEVSRAVDGEWTAREASPEIIGYGTRIEINVVQTEQGTREYWRVVQMRVTSYTPASSGKPADHPEYGITASGATAGKGVVGVDRAVVPFLSNVYVPGYGVAFVGDTGGGVRGRWIDLGYGDDDFEPWWGYADVYYLTPVPAPEDINYLLPDVLP